MVDMPQQLTLDATSAKFPFQGRVWSTSPWQSKYKGGFRDRRRFWEEWAA